MTCSPCSNNEEIYVYDPIPSLRLIISGQIHYDSSSSNQMQLLVLKKIATEQLYSQSLSLLEQAAQLERLEHRAF